MKTITEPQKTWNFSFSCSVCLAQLEADQDDLRFMKKKKYDFRGGDYDGDCFFVECPHCQYQTEIKEDQIPPLIKRLAQVIKRLAQRK